MIVIILFSMLSSIMYLLCPIKENLFTYCDKKLNGSAQVSIVPSIN